jgi:hypothetical protein
MQNAQPLICDARSLTSSKKVRIDRLGERLFERDHRLEAGGKKCGWIVEAGGHGLVS